MTECTSVVSGFVRYECVCVVLYDIILTLYFTFLLVLTRLSSVRFIHAIYLFLVVERWLFLYDIKVM